MASFFISHSSRDNAQAKRLRTWLTRKGYVAVFLDFEPENGIPPGRHWESELYSQLRRADVLLFLGTAASVASRWCHTELAMSRALGRTIIPLRLEPGARHPLVDDLQWLSIVLNGDEALQPLILAFERLRIDALDTPDWDSTLPPYPGLEPFDENRAGVFYGRRDEIATVLRELRQPQAQGVERLLLVAGASGSGKSSLVRAGVVPRLRLLEPGWVFLPFVVPGQAPLEMLARSLASASKSSWSDVAERLPRVGLASLARDLLDPAAPGEPSVLLVVDQAEQLATQCTATERIAFLKLVADALAPGSPLRVVATLRSEYLSEVLAGSALEGTTAPVVSIGRLSSDRLAEVIEEPATRAGIDFEPGLVTKMVEDTKAGAAGGDPLPLLAFTLRQLWETRKENAVRITLDDYARVGGVVGALKAEADRTLARLQREGLDDAVVPTLLELVHVEADREPAARTVARARFDERENRVLDEFVNARLLTVAGDEGVVNVAHEALLREWKLLVDAIDESRAELIARTRLERDAREWAAKGRERSYLVGGRRLQEAEAALRRESGESDPLLGKFVAASRAQARRQTWRTWALIGLAVAVVVALLVVGAVFLVRHVRDGQARDAARAQTVDLRGGGAVDQHEVINAAYRLCIQRGSCTSPAGVRQGTSFASKADTEPVFLVDAKQAATFCSWVGRVLPTADELRRAARTRGIAYLQEGGQEWTRTTRGAANLTVHRNPDGSTTTEPVSPAWRDFDLVFRCAES